jgi:hypothetical protein
LDEIYRIHSIDIRLSGGRNTIYGRATQALEIKSEHMNKIEKIMHKALEEARISLREGNRAVRQGESNEKRRS